MTPSLPVARAPDLNANASQEARKRDKLDMPVSTLSLLANDRMWQSHSDCERSHTPATQPSYEVTKLANGMYSIWLEHSKYTGEWVW